MLVPMQGVESVAVGVYVGTGSRFETPKINGISHFLEHMVFKGTKNFPTHRDTSYLEGLGAIQNAWTGVDATCYYCKIPADKWREGLDLVKDLALYPTIPEQDLEIERGVILEEINRRDDRPDEQVEEELMALMYGNNPLGMTVLGVPEVIRSLSRDDFLQYHNLQYTAKNTVVVLAGKINSTQVQKQIEKWFEEMEDKSSKPLVELSEIQNKSRTRYLKRKLAAQAHVEMGFEGVTVTDPRRFALTIMTAYLGQGLSSKLFLEVREKLGLCYAIRAGADSMVDTGLWSVYAGLNVDKLEQAIEAILKELARVRTEKLSEKELAEAKEKIRGPLLFSKENPMHQMDFYGKQALDRPDEILTYDKVVEKIMTVDTSMILNVAQSIFKSQSINIAVVGPVEKNRVEKLTTLVNLN